MIFISSLVLNLGILASFISGSYIGAINHVALAGASGNTAAIAHFDIHNNGPQAALFHLNTNQQWLTASAQDSTDMLLPSGFTASIDVSADTSRLPAGSFSGNITIAAQDIGTGELYDSQAVAVDLTVTTPSSGTSAGGGLPTTTVSPMPSPSATPQVLALPSTTPKPSATPKPKPSPSPSVSAKPKPSSKLSASVFPSALPVPSPSSSVTEMPSFILSESPVASETPSPTPAPSPSVSARGGVFTSIAVSFGSFISGVSRFFKGLFH